MRLAILVSVFLASAAVADERLEHFEKKVRPLLVERCVKCHGAEKQKGGLRLDSAEGWKTGGDSGSPIVAGDAAASKLIKAILYTDRDLKMPPDSKLADKDIASLEKWVADGAVDPRQGPANKKHSTEKLVSSLWSMQLPVSSAPPAVKNEQWIKNDIDRFILAKLEAANLTPAPEASQETLKRRLSFDLLGLPTGFENMEQALASREYAERWAQHWLDAARFAESSGGGRTLPFKDAWRYRDYVITSMEKDLPLDRFIEEQIAGDLMPYETSAQRRQQVTATGYLVLGAHNYEEQDKDLLRMDIVDEQLDTLGRSLLGMTISCARCHDHKFDPIPTKDYYALAGILRSTKLIRDPNENVAHWIDHPLPLDGEAEQKAQAGEKKLAEMEKALADASKQLKALTPKREPADGKKRPLAVNEVPGIVVDDSDAEQVGAWNSSSRYPTYIGIGYLHDDGLEKGALSLTYTPKIKKAGRYEVRFSYTSTRGRATNVPIHILHADGEAEVTVDQSTLPPIDGRFVSLGQYRFEATGQGFVLVSNADTDGVVTADAVTFIPVEEINELAAADEAALAKANPELAAVTANVKKLEREMRVFEKNMTARPVAMAVAEHEDRGDAAIHIRGSIRNLGKKVPRGFIQAAWHEPKPPAMPADESGRLELAGWITSPKNPLTARVLANRVWMHLFGEGLVRTPDNFGTTGEPPTHPELLDHLALYLQKHEWSLKSLVRYITSSASYRMSSRAVHDAADPENRLLHSQRRRRLDANALRDTLLLISGKLDRTYLGPNIEKAIAAKDSNNTDVLNLEYGYQFVDTRRSLYTPAFRNKRHELFDAFDFNDVNQSLVKRNVSTVSPQALYMMNNEFVINAAKDTAATFAGKPVSESISKLYEQALGRQPTKDEVQLCRDFLSTEPSVEDWALMIQSVFASPDFRYVE
jgi:cytochrome c553